MRHGLSNPPAVGWWLFAVTAGVGVFHILFPEAAKAIWDYTDSARRARWTSGDLSDFNPFERRRYHSNPSWYRGLGVVFILLAVALLLAIAWN